MFAIRKRMLVVVFGAALCAIAVGAASAMAASEDTWTPPGFAAASKSTTFVSGPLTITCTSSTASGNSIGSAPDIGALAMKAPTFKNCTDNFMGTDTVTTNPKGWTISFVSDSADPGCPTGTGNDEAGGSDCVVIGVPQNAATIVVGGLGGCTVTVQPGGPTTVGATVTDPGTAKDTFGISNAPLTASGCGATNQPSTYTGTYTLSSPNGGKLVDGS